MKRDAFDNSYRGPVSLYAIPPIETPAILQMKAENPVFRGHKIMVHAYRAMAGQHEYHVGFGVFGPDGPTLPCGAVIERMMAVVPDPDELFVRTIAGEARAWERTLRTLQAFRGKLLLMAYENAEVSDAAMVPLYTAPEIFLRFSDQTIQ